MESLCIDNPAVVPAYNEEILLGSTKQRQELWQAHLSVSHFDDIFIVEDLADYEAQCGLSLEVPIGLD